MSETRCQLKFIAVRFVNFLLKILENKVLNVCFHIWRLKPALFFFQQGKQETTATVHVAIRADAVPHSSLLTVITQDTLHFLLRHTLLQLTLSTTQGECRQ